MSHSLLLLTIHACILCIGKVRFWLLPSIQACISCIIFLASLTTSVTLATNPSMHLIRPYYKSNYHCDLNWSIHQCTLLGLTMNHPRQQYTIRLQHQSYDCGHIKHLADVNFTPEKGCTSNPTNDTTPGFMNPLQIYFQTITVTVANQHKKSVNYQPSKQHPYT